ncbi:YbaB/EbfC family nucleoid-associated protein [Micromonospora carbonacea]|uniref:YbaB/EbfC family nucleoid-associated protein n=1 Tax=Micromonospora carbonacea TaxID=47853 RepID=UPI00371D487D
MEFSERIESLFQRYQQQRDGLGALRRRMRSIAVTSTSPRREVSVTVGHNGVVSDITFPTNAYRRLAPAELRTLLMQTMGEAREEAQSQAAAVIAPLLPDGMNARDLISGDVDTDTLLPPQPRMVDSVRQQLGLGRVSE